MSKIKLLLVDDSSIIRRILKGFFKDDDQIEVADEAVNGKVAFNKISEQDFDMVLLDYEMPEMNGLELLKEIKNKIAYERRPPVMIFSSLTNSGSKHTIDCLLAGAKDYIQKPSFSTYDTNSLNNFKSTIKEKILSVASKKHKKYISINENFRSDINKPKLKHPGLVLIGSSTGGPAALEEVLKKIPVSFRFPILIVQHMPEKFTKILADSLDKNCAIKVLEVNEKTNIQPGHAYIAAGGKHMVMIDPYTVDSVLGDTVNFCMPSVDVLFESISKIYNKGIISVILTGMGRDGADGVKSLKQNLECYSITQDQASSVVWAMPKAVYDEGVSDISLPIEDIGDFIANV